MSEDLIIKHCSPTLAGIKTANLFNCPYSSRLECECDVRRLNKMFCKKGIKVLPLKFSNGKALIYIFRPSKLAVDLSDKYACKLLESQGYHSHDAARCIRSFATVLKTQTSSRTKSDCSSVILPKMSAALFFIKEIAVNVQAAGRFTVMKKKQSKNLPNSKNVLTSITLSGYKAHLSKS